MHADRQEDRRSVVPVEKIRGGQLLRGIGMGGLLAIAMAAVVGAVAANGQLAALRSRLDALEHRVTAMPPPTIAPAPAVAPAPVLAGIADTGTASGPPDAPVIIVEFSDFECPFCAQLQPTLEQVREQYGSQVRFVFRHFPLTAIHPNAWKAAEAALCAREQGRFWELHAAMFNDQGALDVPNLKATARRLGLDDAAFDQCLDSDRYYDAVHADVQAGSAAGVNGTPALFINGRHVEGAVPFVQLAAVIDAAFQ